MCESFAVASELLAIDSIDLVGHHHTQQKRILN